MVNRGLVKFVAAISITIAIWLTACSNTSETADTPKSDQDATAAKSDHDMSNMNSSDMTKMGHNDDKGKAHVSTEYTAHKKGNTEAIAIAAENIDKALAEKNKEKAIEGAKLLLTAFENFDSSKLDESKKKEYDEIVESAKEHAEHITKSELNHQIEHYEGLSKDLKDLFTLVGTE